MKKLSLTERHGIQQAADAARAEGLIPAISYCRVSGVEQVKGMSLDNQAKMNLETAERHGARIVHTIRGSIRFFV